MCGEARNGRRNNHQGGAILHGLRQSRERIAYGDDKRSSKRFNLRQGGNRRSNSLLRSRSLGKNESRLTNPLSMSTLIYGYWLNGRDASLGRNSLCSSRSGRGHKLSHHISPIEETLYGCTHGGRNFLNHGVIYGDRLGLSLKNVKQKNKKKRKGEQCMIIDDAERR